MVYCRVPPSPAAVAIALFLLAASPRAQATTYQWGNIAYQGTLASGDICTTDGVYINCTISPSSVSGTPGGSNMQIQYNNSGAFGGAANFVWNNTNNFLGLGTGTANAQLHISGANAISAPAWTTNGIGIRQDGQTYTDTSSSGTQGNPVYFDVIGQPTLAASNATTFASAATLYIAGAPNAGTNATITSPAALVVGDGYVGLGMGSLLDASPLPRPLNIADWAGGNSRNGSIRLGADPSYYGELNFIFGSELRLNAHDNTGIDTFYTNNTERMRITATGNVGIGTTAPQNGLDIGTSAAVGGIHIGSVTPTNTAYALYNSNGTLYWNGVALASANTPSAFSFTNQTGVSTGATITSNAVTLSGFAGTVNATCGAGCAAIARNGVWGGTTVNGFQAGDTIAIQQTSSGSTNTATNATVTAGGTTSGTWTVTTTSSTPAAFSFTNVSGASANWTYTSNAVTLTGFTGTLTAICSGACVSMAHNGIWSGTTTIAGFAPNDTIAIRVVSAASLGGSVTATATVGSTVSGTWTVTTAAGCQTGITIGQACPDGTIFAGTSPDGNVPMYTTPCDAAQYWSGSSCATCGSGMWTGSGTTCGTAYSSGSLNMTTWNNGSSSWTTTGYTSGTTGKANTAGLYALSDAGSPYRAASYCATLNAYGHADWYLPAQQEISVMYANAAAIGNFDVTDGGNQVGGGYPGLYWSSSEDDPTGAWSERFSDGYQYYYYYYGFTKNFALEVRCVRR